MNSIQEAIALIDPLPRRPEGMPDNEFLVWLFECACLNVAMDKGGIEAVQEYGALKGAIAKLLIKN